MTAANWWVEVWDHPAIGTTRHIARLPVYDARGRDRLSQPGQGHIVTDRRYLSDLVDPDGAARMIRIVHNGREALLPFIAEHAVADVADNARIRVYGSNLFGALTDGAVYPHDTPAAGETSTAPDWIWGGPNVLQNGDLESSLQETDSTTGAGTGTFLPTHWTPTPIGALASTGFRLATEPDGGVADSVRNGTYSLRVNPLTAGGVYDGQWGGAQQIVAVTPGTTYWARIWAMTPDTTAPNWRLIVRDLNGNEIASDQAPAGADFALAANTWTAVDLTNLVIPDGVNHVIFRMAFTQNVGNPLQMYFDDMHLRVGLKTTTFGDILLQLLSPIQTRGALSWLNTSAFSASLDAAGNTWDTSELSFTVQAGTSGGFLDACTQGARLGYETMVAPVDDTDPTQGYRLLPFNPAGAGTVLTSDASKALVGPPLRGAEPTQGTISLPPKNHIYVMAANGGFGTAADAADETNHGRRESVIRPATISDATAAAAYATAQIADQATATRGVRARLNHTHPVQPGRDIHLGDSTLVDYTPTVGRFTHRVVGYQGQFDDSGVLWDVDTNRLVWDTPESPTEVLLRLARETRTPQTSGSAAGIVSGLAGISATADHALPFLVVAAHNAPDKIKARADYICTGTNDHLVIQSAIDWWNGKGFGAVHLSGGVFNMKPSGTTPDPLIWLNPGVNSGCVELRGVNAHDWNDQIDNDGFGLDAATKIVVFDQNQSPSAEKRGAIQVTNAVLRDVAIAHHGIAAHHATVFAQNNASLYNVGIGTGAQECLHIAGGQRTSQFHDLYLAPSALSPGVAINVRGAVGSSFQNIMIENGRTGFRFTESNGTARIEPVYGCAFSNIYATGMAGSGYLFDIATPSNTAAWPTGHAFQANVVSNVRLATSAPFLGLFRVVANGAWLGANTFDLSSIHDDAGSPLFAGVAATSPFYTSRTTSSTTANLPAPATVRGETRFDSDLNTFVRSNGTNWVPIGTAGPGGPGLFITAEKAAHKDAALSATLT